MINSTLYALVRKAHLLADNGAYFVANAGQSGITSPAIAAYSATAPMLTVFNSNPVGGRRIYLDYLALITMAAGSFASAGVNLQLAVDIDSGGDRYASGGTVLTGSIVNPNQDSSATSAARVRFGAITASAATGAVRHPVGLRVLRPAASSTVADVVGEQKLLNFGCVEQMLNGSIVAANPNSIPIGLPPIIIGGQQNALIYFIMNGTTPGAVSFAPELGWFEM